MKIVKRNVKEFYKEIMLKTKNKTEFWSISEIQWINKNFGYGFDDK